MKLHLAVPLVPLAGDHRLGRPAIGHPDRQRDSVGRHHRDRPSPGSPSPRSATACWTGHQVTRCRESPHQPRRTAGMSPGRRRATPSWARRDDWSRRDLGVPRQTTTGGTVTGPDRRSVPGPRPASPAGGDPRRRHRAPRTPARPSTPSGRRPEPPSEGNPGEADNLPAGSGTAGASGIFSVESEDPAQCVMCHHQAGIGPPRGGERSGKPIDPGQARHPVRRPVHGAAEHPRPSLVHEETAAVQHHRAQVRPRRDLQLEKRRPTQVAVGRKHLDGQWPGSE
ncbi:hypothetical protein SAMN02787118_109155 [Streptomyces mirabilis]|uniref:Uncharacterized protein n=1 Tax=Streptomyces mirabilis TaxID=68239 RepID=A0A1I2K495_9ACTN|nr:hypothetical protein SAMN02787118_109155 [Streptomyces mirabilis]